MGEERKWIHDQLLRIRQKLRQVSGRTRWDAIEERLDQVARDHHSEVEEWRSGLSGRLDGLMSEVGNQVDGHLGELFKRHEDFEARVLEHLELVMASLSRLELEREQLSEQIQQMRQTNESGVEVLGRLDNRVLRYCEICDRIDNNLIKTHERISGLAEKIEDRHGHWETDVKLTIEKLDQIHQSLTEAERQAVTIRDLTERTEDSERRATELADQTAHVLEMLGQARRSMREMKERADQLDEARAARADLERELGLAKGEIATMRGELLEVRGSYETFRTWKDTLGSELKRLTEERDRLLLRSTTRNEGSDGQATEDPQLRVSRQGERETAG